MAGSLRWRSLLGCRAETRLGPRVKTRCRHECRHGRLENLRHRWSALTILSLLSLCSLTAQHAPAVHFEDVAASAGLKAPNTFGGLATKKYILESTGSGAAFIDYDNDGYLDIFLVNGSRLEGFRGGQEPSNYLFHNNRDGTFTDVTEKAGLKHSGWGQGVCVGDYDNDGFDDLFVTYYGKNVLYRNRGNGTFEDVTRKAGLLNEQTRWGTGCAFVDYNKDGWLDLFVVNYVEFDIKTAPLPGSSLESCRWKGIPVFCGPRGFKGGQNILYKNRGDGTFTDVSAAAGILKKDRDHYSLGVATSDFDNDGWPDIYVACDSTANILYHNNGDGTFTDTALLAGVAYNEDGREQAGMGVGIGDYDRNGFFDIVKTNFSDDTPTLYRNTGDGSFSDRTTRARLALHTRYLGWGTGFLDYDNDGWPDIFMANGHVYPEIDARGMNTSFRQRNLLYRNLGDGAFQDVSVKTGPGLMTEKSARGVSFGDYDNDGGVDILINNMNDLPTLLHNNGGNRNHWLRVKTVGTRSNRDGIGARVTVFYGSERQTDEVRSGGSWASQSDLRVHFGLGSAEKVDRLEIRWPSGLVENLYHLGANQSILVKEGESRKRQ